MIDMIAAQAAAFKRNAEGFYRHPDMPAYLPDIQSQSEGWILGQGCQLHTVKERITADEFVEWAPEPPDGDGWFTLQVTKNGSVASWAWARKVTP